MDILVRILADGGLIIVAVIGAAALLRGIKVSRIPKDYPLAVMAGLTSLLIAKLASLLYQPSVARPFIEQGVVAGAAFIDNPGFPSDHALLAGVVVVAVYALTPYKRTAGFLLAVTIIMSIARVMALVHTPVDVIAGLLIAGVGGIWYLQRPK